MRKEEIVVMVDRRRFRAILQEKGIMQRDLCLEMGHGSNYLSMWVYGRGGFPQKVVDILEEKGIHAADYEPVETHAEETHAGPDIEEAIVRALERFYGTKEGDYGRWFISTVNAIVKNACREASHDSEV